MKILFLIENIASIAPSIAQAIGAYFKPNIYGTISIENTSALNDDIIVANFEALSLFSDLLIFENRIM